MATSAPVYEERRMDVGRVFQRAFAAIRLNPVVILGLALVVGAVPGLLMAYLFVQLGLTTPDALQTGAVSISTMFAAAVISGIVGMVISALVQGALTRATVSAIEGRRTSFGESLGTGFRVILPLIGLSILWAFGVGIGFIFLIVPGVILLLMWAVCIPALVIERQGVFAAFSRSSSLTQGARGKILGLFFVLLVIYWLMTGILSVVGLGRFGAGTSTQGLTVANIVGSIVVGTLFNALWGTIQSSLYIELRQWKEGDSAENLEQIFA
jgi:hypothetical protein